MEYTTDSIPRVSAWTDFKEITKSRLSISVVFSSIAGFFLGIPDVSWDILGTLGLLAVGGYCMVGASNAYNQVIEKDLDLLMLRTKNRPVPANRISAKSA
ncbi:UbiA family prenyltransferase, partial [Arthrospira platensis SPKY1]|nr:UbiA family prenyltransferase [Arthrospira platensis SPKY1]